MYDHERSLVTELEGKPFALIGCNFADKLSHIRKAVADKNLNWRSFFLGENDEVVKSFNVEGFPTVIIIDAKGVVRSVGHGTEDELINKLIAEVEADTPRP